jgi:hypothetical protein
VHENARAEPHALPSSSYRSRATPDGPADLTDIIIRYAHYISCQHDSRKRHPASDVIAPEIGRDPLMRTAVARKSATDEAGECDDGWRVWQGYL